MNVPLRCPDYTSVSKRAKSVNVSFKTFTRGEIAHLVIDSTGLKVFGEGEWKVKKHGKERRRIWRKLHLAVDSNTHEIICADLSLNNVTDSEAFPGLIRQTHRKIRAASADGAYDTRLCHDELRRKKISALIPPRKGAGYWPGEYADRNRAVANQRLTGSNARWKWTTDYNRRSIAETAMYRVKQLFGGSLTLRDYDGQVAEAMALVRALNNFEQQRYRASGLNLVTAAIVLWNTVYLERATQGLVEAGKPVDGELLQFLSPLGWEHINLTGDYVWRQSRRLEDGKFRPLRMPGKP
ncbi:IS5 family transposase (plasmid) [Klebsiella pneumoniae]|uniref:IS5 family transposase n=1 Tax=Klebsiella pneumoniae TaxID=573 RepID=UPI0029CA0854|nr:IS5 family transposase [Klebsiella pneumoniae]WPI78577.1 IS5 family transposase [Klebsiella pneumoniae]